MSAARPAVVLPCAVLGGGITGLGVVRSLGRVGLRPFVFSRPGDLAGRSRWATEHIKDVPESSDPSALVKALVEHGLDEAVLFPCSDTWAQAVARMSGDDRACYPTTISPPEVLDLLVDKELFSATLDRLEIAHPRTRPIAEPDDVDVAELEGFFLKPSNSQRFNVLYGDKAFRFGSREEVQEGLRLMAAAGVHALVQEYIPGPPDRHYFVDGYLDRGAALRAVFVRRRTRMFPASFGNSSHMVTVTPASAEPAVQEVVRLLTAIGHRGVFSAEFKHDPRDEVFKLLEVNARPWWYIGFAAECGVDMCKLSYRDALGLDLETVSGYPVGERCVLFHLDVKAYLHERRTSGLTLAAWLRSLLGARPTVFSWDDPGPALAMYAEMSQTRSRRVLGGRLRKLFGREG